MQWAQREWAWLSNAPFYTAGDGLLMDGLDAHNCGRAVGAKWTYNQACLSRATPECARGCARTPDSLDTRTPRAGRDSDGTGRPRRDYGRCEHA